MAALTTNVKRPRVTMLKGSVRISAIGRITALTIPRTSAASRAALKLGTFIPGTMSVVRYSATALISHRMTNRILVNHYTPYAARPAGPGHAPRGGPVVLDMAAHEAHRQNAECG